MKQKSNNYFEYDSIDLIQLLSVLWKNKFTLLKTSMFFLVVGIIFSLSLKNYYKASSIFYPHIEKVNNTQGLKSLAGLAGININDQISDNIPTSLYPNLINSPKFKIEILDEIINHKGVEISYRDYLKSIYNESYSIKEILLLPINFIRSIITKNNFFDQNNYEILKLSEEEYKLHKILSEKIVLNLNEQEGFIDLSVEDYNPYIASQITKKANSILQKSIIDFKLKNISDTFKFVDSQLNIAKKNFYNLQDSLAIFKDNNINIKSDLFKNQYSRIESEFLLSKNIYNELAINKEKIAIDVQKNTPIFTIIKPVVIPNEKSGPNRTLIVFLFLFTGLITSSIYILFKKSFLDIIKKIST